MDVHLQLLETFVARGSDGAQYKVCAFDRMTRDPTLQDEHWESTGSLEYRLSDGRTLEVHRDGTARVAGSDLVLSMPARATVAEAGPAGR
jgi:hypothetical protein